MSLIKRLTTIPKGSTPQANGGGNGSPPSACSVVDIVCPALRKAEVHKRTGGVVAPSLEHLSRGIPSVKDGLTIFHPPAELPTAPGSGLFLDEINASARAVMAAGMQLVLDRTLGAYHAPEGMPIWAAGNRVADKAVANRMPSALNNRFMHFIIGPDPDSFVEYALAQGWPVELVAFIRFRPELLHAMENADKDGQGFPSPRSWEMTVNTNAWMAPAQLRRALMKAAVGPGAALEVEQFLAIFNQLPGIDQVTLNPHGAELPKGPGPKGAMAAALSRAVTEQTIDAVFTYLGRFQEPEYLAMVAQNIAVHKQALVNTRAFITWASANNK